jgi:hypothetical protein
LAQVLQSGFPARSIARATACAIEQPAGAEIVIRPTAQDFCGSAEAEQSLKTRRYMNFKNNRQELGITLVNHVGYEQSRSAGKDEHSHVATSLLSHGEG